MPARSVFAALLVVPSLLLLPAAAAPTSADLSIMKSVSPDPVTVGDDLQAAIVVSNAGPDAADAVAVDDTVPGQVSVGPVTPSQGTCTETTNAVHCDLGTVAAGSGATVNVVVAPLAPGTVQDTATVSSGTADPDASNDTATASATARGTACTITGTWSNDSLTGTDGADVLCGLGGDDTLSGGAGDDILYGGGGTDLASFLDAEEPIDASLRAHTAEGDGADQLEELEGIVGSGHDDVLRGDPGPNVLQGEDGNDVLLSMGGDDRLDGGTKDDFLSGGTGTDVFTGGSGTDTCLPAEGTRTDRCPGRTRSDANDTRGTFDVSQATITPGQPARVRITTFSKWSVFGMWDHGEFLVQIDTMGTADPEYYVLVRADRSRLIGAMFSVGAKRDVHRFRVPVTHASGHVIVIPIALGRLRFAPGRAYYRWSVQSMWNDVPCKRVCIDHVDDEGAIPELRP